jgi:hypothetical protein
MNQSYGLLIAADGEWEVINTEYSFGIMDKANHDGEGFTFLVAPASHVDYYLGIDNLTGADYLAARKSKSDHLKMKAIENFWGLGQKQSHKGKLHTSLVEHFTKETTDWEVRAEYTNRNKHTT